MAHKLSHKLTQRLLITPQLKQTLRLLQLPYPALRNYIEQQITENPLLLLLFSYRGLYLKQKPSAGNSLAGGDQFKEMW